MNPVFFLLRPCKVYTVFCEGGCRHIDKRCKDITTYSHKQLMVTLELFFYILFMCSCCVYMYPEQDSQVLEELKMSISK